MSRFVNKLSAGERSAQRLCNGNKQRSDGVGGNKGRGKREETFGKTHNSDTHNGGEKKGEMCVVINRWLFNMCSTSRKAVTNLTFRLLDTLGVLFL